MSDILSTSRLSFFKVDKYIYDTSYICDFSSIPRPHFCMGLILRGSGVFKYENKSVSVNEGDIIFVPVGSTYISQWHGIPGVEYISIHFSFEFPGPFPRNSRLKIQKITLPDPEKTARLYANIYEGCNSEKSTQLSVLGEFYSLMSEIYSYLEYTEVPKLDDRIDKAVQYIEYHYKESFPIEALAKLCNMSISQFYSCFKASLGCSPLNYKHTICIRHAELLLIDGKNRSIENISAELGFSSAIYFREIFKKITGKTPGEYRKTNIE